MRLEDEGFLTYQPREKVRARLYATSNSTFYLLRAAWSFTFRAGTSDRRNPRGGSMKDGLRKVRSLSPLAVAVLLLAACSNSVPQPEASEKPVIRLTGLQQFESDELFHDVRDVAVAPDGSVWVLSAYEPHLRLYSATGNLETRFGRSGAGPGELKNPWYLIPIDEGAVQVWDVGSRRLEVFHTDGEYVSGRAIDIEPGTVLGSIRQQSHGEPLRVGRVGDDLWFEIYDGILTRTSEFWNGKLVRVDSNGGTAGEVLRYRTLEGEKETEERRIFSPTPLWTPCGAERAVILNPLTEEAIWLNADGNPVKTVPLDLPDRPVSKKDVERFVSYSIELEARERGIDHRSPGVVRLARKTARSILTDTPEFGPPVRIRCDGAERLWVQLFSTEFDPRGYGSDWQVFDGETGQLARFPTGFQPMIFTDDRVVGTLTDSLGVQRIAAVPLIL